MGSSLPEEIHEVYAVYPLRAQPSHLPRWSRALEIVFTKLFCAGTVLPGCVERGPLQSVMRWCGEPTS